MIVKVEQTRKVCRETHIDKGKWLTCNTPLVVVTFDSGRTMTVHDDGSFIAYTGEQG